MAQCCLESELDIESLRGYPSILFGLETALRHYETQSWALWDTPFSRGEGPCLLMEI